MKRMLVVTLILGVALVVVGLAVAGEMQLKVGDQVYACNCGEACLCDTLAMRPSKCGCGREMVPGAVVEVGEGTVVVQTDSWKRSFKTVGKYTCACGAGCTCNTVSQTAGQCACGRDLAEAAN